MPPQKQPLISAREAAIILDCDKGTVIRWGHDGTLRIAKKLPGKNGPMLFDEADVVKLAEEHAAIRRPRRLQTRAKRFQLAQQRARKRRSKQAS